MERDRFEEEARRVRPRLVSEARRLLGDPDDADDAVQDAMLKLWFYRERLDGYSSFDAPAIVTVRRVSQPPEESEASRRHKRSRTHS
ncbi:sigma factor [Paramuribaculum intestinale]|uniref:sigma factor n=1 Tax=Paramuribaculum intestinale TaxID=2094151 RepID=UPI0025B420F3|nr:sigma factor [Paramuribaculum intestinale]